jgi:hypothetical protein
MTRDPFPGMAALPGTQNPYAYGLNNPVRYTDPSGKLVPLLLLGALIGGGFGAFSYWQTQPCATFSSLLNDPGFWQAALIGAGAGMAAGLVGAGVAAFGAGAFGGSIWGAVITGAVGGGLAGGVGEGVAQLLAYGNIRNPQLVGVAMLSGVGSGGLTGAIGWRVGQRLVPRTSEAMKSGVVYRGGSATARNLTPRPGIDTTGLSTFDSLEAAAAPGEKAQVSDVSLLKPPLLL